MNWPPSTDRSAKARERRNHTLQPTALITEAHTRLIDMPQPTSTPTECLAVHCERRADHSSPQHRHVYHAMTHVLSAAGSTSRPQKGHEVTAVAGKVLDMRTQKATPVPAPRPASASESHDMRSHPIYDSRPGGIHDPSRINQGRFPRARRLAPHHVQRPGSAASRACTTGGGISAGTTSGAGIPGQRQRRDGRPCRSCRS
jgi:hypothetical protein